MAETWTVIKNKLAAWLGTAAAEDVEAFTPAAHAGAGGTAHANATTSAAGFMSNTDKTKSDALTVESASVLNQDLTTDAGPTFDHIHLVNNLILASGKGIDFSANAHAGGMAGELLDDYEKGSCTLTLTFGGNSVGITYDSQTGYYSKVGDLAAVGAYFAISNKGSSTGTALITGLPFTSANLWFGSCAFSFLYGITFTDMPTMHVQANEAYMSLRQNGTTVLTDANFANSSGFIFTMLYKTA
jgi:hypothetical protein